MAAESITSASDSELLGIAINLHSTIEGNEAAYGLTAGFTASLEASKNSFETALANHNAKQAEAKAQTALKESVRDGLEALIRDARRLAKAGKISESLLASMGIPSPSQAAPANATVPAGMVDTRERLRDTISWTDAASLNNKRKPRGTMGAEIWVKVDGPPPGDEKDCTFLTLDAFTPYLAEYEPADAGKTAHYMLRWRMRDGAVSAFGETISATITG